MRRTSVALILGMALPVQAAPELRPADIDRLDRLEEAAGRALLDAMARGAAPDVATVTQALSGRPIVPQPSGDWNCRTIKAGGPVGLVVYTDFLCRITILGPTEWQFEKLTGSQRTRGTIAFRDGRAIYRGVGYVGDAPATDYAGLPSEQVATEPGQTVPQVAVFEQTAPDRARLIFPYPLLESDLDILVLTR